jgi:hypothetical protein
VHLLCGAGRSPGITSQLCILAGSWDYFEGFIPYLPEKRKKLAQPWSACPFRGAVENPLTYLVSVASIGEIMQAGTMIFCIDHRLFRGYGKHWSNLRSLGESAV